MGVVSDVGVRGARVWYDACVTGYSVACVMRHGDTVVRSAGVAVRLRFRDDVRRIVTRCEATAARTQYESYVRTLSVLRPSRRVRIARRLRLVRYRDRAAPVPSGLGLRL